MDREKVIKGLECCECPTEKGFVCECSDCPYYCGTTIKCRVMLKIDVFALLKEQEAVEPYITGRGETFETAETWWYACGNCHEALDVNDKYCRHCGRSVKWE